MRKTYFPIGLFLIIIVFACKEKKTNENLKLETENKVVFKIDERTEFFRTIFNIAAQDVLPEDIRPCQTEYLKRVNGQFLQYKNHPLINWIYEDENIGIDFSTIGLMYKDLNKFEFNDIYEKELQSIGLTKKVLDSVRPLMIDFYQKSGFGKFFKENKEYYNQAISVIESQVSKEKLFDKVMRFYQEKNNEMELDVFVELTNNANNRAMSFYENYSITKRAYILGNFCELPSKSDNKNETLKLDNDIRGILYHETSHLYTDKLLDKYIGNLNQYKSICNDCNEIQIRDKVDHLIVRPLQAIMMKRFDKNNTGDDFYLKNSKDIGKKVYTRLSQYDPESKIPFEKVYNDCINLIKESASE